MDDVLKYWPVAVTLFNVAFLVAGWALMKTFATKKELDEEGKARATAETRITIIEERLKNHPDHDDLGDIHERINEALSGISQAIAGISGLVASVRSLENQVGVLLEVKVREGK
ncbi:MAG: DUF2730 domain-containing protein [Magnetospirillum sp. WYHS-4]